MDLVCFSEIMTAFFLGCIMSAFILPRISLVSLRCRLFDQVNSRKIHRGHIPRLGGIAFFPCIFIAVSLVICVNYRYIGKAILDLHLITGILSLFSCLFLIYMMGMMDDLIGVRYRSKFVIQILCGILIVASGLCFDSFYGLLGVYEIPGWAGKPFTVLIIVFILNAINLIDGIDGLASGLSMIAFFAFGCMYIRLGWWLHALLAFATLGVLIPFFYYNVFGKICRGRKIFMGDTGSLTIGMLLAVMAIRLSMTNVHKDAVFPGSVVIAFSFLIVPMLDVVRVVIHRVRSGKSPFLPDKNHIHHKFIALGMNQHAAMICIIVVAAVFAIMNVTAIQYVSSTVMFLIDIIVWTMMNVWITVKITKGKKQRTS